MSNEETSTAAAENIPTRGEVAVLMRNAGLSSDPKRFEETFDAYQHVMAMVNRLKSDFSFADEPAHVYLPLSFQSGPDEPSNRS
jgi:hypothetical protein